MQDSSDGELYQFVVSILKRWKVIAALTLAGLLTAIIYLNSATYKYTVDFRINPTEADMSSLTKRLGGLAAVAGINLGGDKASSPFELYVDAIYSPEVATKLAGDPMIMRNAFDREWNASAGEFLEPVSPAGGAVNGLKGILGIPVYPWEKPDSARLQEFIERNVILQRDPKRAGITLSMEHENPEFAKRLLTSLHSATDNMLRARALDRANQYINYIALKLTEVSLLEHREALAETLGQQERVRMMASSGMPYAGEPLGKPLVSLHPTTPRPIITLVLGFLGGAVAGFAIAACISILQNIRNRAKV